MTVNAFVSLPGPDADIDIGVLPLTGPPGPRGPMGPAGSSAPVRIGGAKPTSGPYVWWDTSDPTQVTVWVHDGTTARRLAALPYVGGDA